MEILIYVFAYVYTAYALQTIARKTGTEKGWFAWIPFLNLYLMCKIAERPGWWIILFFIPIVNLVIAVILWMVVAERRHKPSWWGILTLIPIVNFVIIGILAFSDSSSQPVVGGPLPQQ